MPRISPSPHHIDLISTSLVSDGTYRYAVWYSLDLAKVYFGRQLLSGGAWTTHEFAGADLTAFAPPIQADEHAFASIALLGNGRAIILANLWTHPIRGVISDNAVATDIVNWTPITTAKFPGIRTRLTYPMPIHRPDGSVRFYIREGVEGSGSSRSDSAFWDCPAGSDVFGAANPIFKGLSVPNAKGPGIPGDNESTGTEFNWSAYPAVPVVQDLGGGEFIEHWSWIWRQGSSGRSNVKPSYMQYRSATNSWHTIDGTPITLPVDPINFPEVQMGIVDNGEGFLNYGGMCVDDGGIPHLIISTNPWYYVTWNGSSWTKTTLGAAGGWTYLGQSVTGRVNCIWWRDSMWFMGQRWMGSGVPRIPTLWRYGGVSGEYITLGSPTGDTGGYEFGLDWKRFRENNVIEMLTFERDGLTPFVASIGQGPSVRV